MKKLLFVAILCLAGASAFAQEQKDTLAVKTVQDTAVVAAPAAVAAPVAAEVKDTVAVEAAKDTVAQKDTVQRKGEKDGLNFQLAFGLTSSQNESIDGKAAHTLTLNKDSRSLGGSVALAQEFTPCWGWRATVGLNGNKGRSNNWDAAKAEIYSFMDAEVFGDITLDFMDLFAPKRKSRFFNLKGFVGVGGLYTFGFTTNSSAVNTKSNIYFGARGGLDFRFRLSEKFSLGAEASATFMPCDKYNGIVDDIFFDARLGANISAIWHF